MSISGFTMVRNATKLFFPLREAIMSALPIVDEFIVALGDCDEDDNTRQVLESINDPKIKIYDRIWDKNRFKNSEIFAIETDFALSKCIGTWCLYIQADEVLHENDLASIQNYCQKYENDQRVEGFLFRYYHFWADYEHINDSHNFYKHEVRLVRNHIGAYSYRDAVSFRKGEDEKLRVVALPAYIYHYGHVRPPLTMKGKKEIHDGLHQGNNVIFSPEKRYEYGAIGEFPVFKGTHPLVMKDFIAAFYWSDQLDYGKRKRGAAIHHKHERLKYRLLTKFERNFRNGKILFGFKNYILIKM